MITSMSLGPKSGSMPVRQNVNRFGLDLHGHSNTNYVSPETTPHGPTHSQSHSQSHSEYGPATPLQTYQNPFVPRGYGASSRGSPYHSNRLGQSAPAAYPTPGEVDPYYYPPVLSSPPKVGSAKKKVVKKADGKQPTFLTKLYAILEAPEYNHIIRWDEAGTMIIIDNPEELSKQILPLVYRQSRFASFSRQLNIYGWRRRTSLRHAERGIVDPDASTWTHDHLRRDSSRDELVNFKRRVPPRPSQSIRGQRSEMPEMDYGSDPYSSPDAYHSHLMDEQYPYFQTQAHPGGGFWSHAQSPSQAQSQSYHNGPPPLVLSSPFSLAERARPAPIAITPSQGQSQHSSSTNGSFSFGNSMANSNTTMTPSSNGSHLNIMAAPQTAPLANTMHHTPITRGHNRTRSYQCNSPLNPNPLFIDQPMANLSMSSPLSKSLGDGISTTKATYNPIDPSTWARRGFTDFDGNPMPTPSSMPGISSSVPTNFGASIMSNSFHWTPSPPGQEGGPTGTYGSGSGMSGESSPSTPSMAGTVSPAIFQPGYTPPANTGATGTENNGYSLPGADVPMPMPQSNSHLRRPSHPIPTIVPDQPRPRASMHMNHSRTLSLGEPISLQGTGGNMTFTLGGTGSDSRFPTTSTRLSGSRDTGGIGNVNEGDIKPRMEDDSLPSAALRGFTKMPFEGMLPEHDEPMPMGP